MPKLTAFIHAHNDANRIARALDSLSVCNEVLVIVHPSDDNTEEVARSHGARIKQAVPGVAAGAYLVDASHDWVLCLLPYEAVSEELEASLREWKRGEHQRPGFSFRIREQAGAGWRDLPPETRLINRTLINLNSELPPNDPNAEVIPGDLLRFTTP